MTGLIWLGAGFFVFVMSAVMAGGYALLRAEERRGGGLPPALSTEPELPPTRAAFFDLFRSIGERFPGAAKEQNPYRRRLSMAGYRWPSAVAVFYGIKCAAALFLAGAAGIGALTYRADTSLSFIPMLCGAGFGFLLPDRILKSRIRARGRRLRSGLPAALDLMILGIEAGQSIDQTMADCSHGLKGTHPDLGAELAQLHLELRASNSRLEAFRNLAARNDEPELKKLVNLLVDSDRFGAALGPALRSHNRYLRTRFRQRAQEAARKVGVKLIFPVFFLIFPSVLLVTLGPAVMMMTEQLRDLLK